jgi:uncharacterized protein YyaL (SSP411 family)
VYAYENGLLIAALVTAFEASGERVFLARAERAANRLLATHVEPSGAVRHDARSSSPVRFLADAAGLGRAYARLAEATGDARWQRAAERIATWMLDALADSESAAFFAHTVDPDASGVFARRRRPFDHNVLAARFASALARVNGDVALRERALRTLAAISTPAALDEQGRMLGAYLLALDEAGVRPW